MVKTLSKVKLVNPAESGVQRGWKERFGGLSPFPCGKKNKDELVRSNIWAESLSGMSSIGIGSRRRVIRRRCCVCGVLGGHFRVRMHILEPSRKNNLKYARAMAGFQNNPRPSLQATLLASIFVQCLHAGLVCDLHSCSRLKLNFMWVPFFNHDSPLPLACPRNIHRLSATLPSRDSTPIPVMI